MTMDSTYLVQEAELDLKALRRLGDKAPLIMRLRLEAAMVRRG